jgi:D-3-phosphoglycerate dehydrogenase
LIPYQRFRAWELAGRTAGIVGLGAVGRATAWRLAGLGMQVISSDPYNPAATHALDDLLAEADVVSLHCPLTPLTHHLIGAAALKTMRRDAYLVNATRGPVVDEAALVDALREGEIAGAALDVYEREPDVHPGLLTLENAVLVPHLGSATKEAREAMGRLCLEALRAVLLEGRCPDNALNPEIWGDRA